MRHCAAHADEIALDVSRRCALVAAFVLLALTLAVRASEQTSSLKPQAPASGRAPGGEYLGSASCARCHDVEHTQWKNSLHIKMTKPIAEATVLGDFREGTKFPITVARTRSARRTASRSCRGRSAAAPPKPSRRLHPRRETLSGLSRDAARRPHLRAAGVLARRQQALDRLEGNHADPEGAHDLRQIWNSNCFNCHATNIVQGYDIDEQNTSRRGPRWASAARRATAPAASTSR